MNASYTTELVLELATIGRVNTVVANRTFSSVKPSISPSDVALNANPGTVLKSARPEDSKKKPNMLKLIEFSLK